jgi:hypothetical protein
VFLLLLLLVLSPFALFSVGGATPDTGYGTEVAPFVLVAGEEEQTASTGISLANPVTRVQVGDELEIEHLDGSTRPLRLEVRLLACPDRPRLASARVQPGEPWRVPRLESDAYALTVSDGRARGAFGLVVGDGPVREDRC